MSLTGVEGWLRPVVLWIWNATLSASILTLLLLALQALGKRLFSARWLYALWICVLLRLLAPAVPSSRISLLNLFHLKEPAALPVPDATPLIFASPDRQG